MTACSSERPNVIDVAATVDISAPLRVEEVEHSVDSVVVDMAFDEDGRFFYALQDGQIYTKIDPTSPAEKILDIPVARIGFEDGLLSLELAPDFTRSRHFYIYYIEPSPTGHPRRGRVMRYTFDPEANVAQDAAPVLENLPSRPTQQHHFGGGLSFGPDGMLYLILGDTNITKTAQDTYQVPGSIVRFDPAGEVPDDNPFERSIIYAKGIRNGFGLAWHPDTEQLYEIENGTSCDDELNLILPGENYGWGLHDWDACPYPDEGGQAPIYEWTSPIAPSGLMFYTGQRIPEFTGRLLVCGININQVHILTLGQDGRSVIADDILEIDNQQSFCQAALAQGPDGWLYTATAGKIFRIGR